MARLLLLDQMKNGVKISLEIFEQGGVAVVPAKPRSIASGSPEVDLADVIVLTTGETVSSIELCRRLRMQCEVPLLVLCERGDEEQLVRIYQAGADECIVWPTDQRLLLAKVQAWLRWPSYAKPAVLPATADGPNGAVSDGIKSDSKLPPCSEVYC